MTALESNGGEDISWDELHPETQRLLSRRGFVLGLGGGAAAITFMGMTVTGCSSASNSASSTTAVNGSPTTIGTAPPGSVINGKTLYDRLGGGTAVTAVVGAFLAKVAADKRINSFFASTDVPKLQTSVVNLLGQSTGGPQTYTGGDMKSVHAGLKITLADFNAFVEDLVATLNENNVPKQEQTELLALLAPMQPAIVTA